MLLFTIICDEQSTWLKIDADSKKKNYKLYKKQALYNYRRQKGAGKKEKVVSPLRNSFYNSLLTINMKYDPLKDFTE